MINTLFPQAQPKAPRKNILGLMGDTFENTIETLIGGGGYTTENRETSAERGFQPSSFETEQTVNRPTIGGSSEIMFNNPDETGLRAARQIIEQAQTTNQGIEQADQIKDIREEVRFEVAGMSDAQLATEGDFSNTSVTNRSIVRSVANRMWIFLKRVASKLADQKEKTAISVEETKNTGKFAVGENDLINNETQGWKNTPG